MGGDTSGTGRSGEPGPEGMKGKVALESGESCSFTKEPCCRETNANFIQATCIQTP